MAEEPRPTGDSDQPRANGDRLESWKEIAGYLRRDVRTVQRWESDGLPIRRLQRAHRAIPYAYKAELDDWWARKSNGRPADVEATGSPKQAAESVRRRYVTVLLAALLVTAVAGGAYWILRSHSTRSSIGLAPALFVTTSSKTAVSLFDQANQILEENGDNHAAEALLREAISNDAGFASAHIFLAWTLLRERRPAGDYLPFADRAEQLADRVTVSERLFIRGSALRMRGQEKEACGAFDALVRMQPDHFWGTQNFANCQPDRGDRFGRADFSTRLADLRPADIDQNVQAAWSNEFLIDNPSRAELYFRRAEQLQRDGHYSRTLNSDSWLRFHHAYRRWLRDDVDGALNQIVTTVERDDRRLIPPAREEMYTEAGQFMLTLGRLEDAARMFKRIPTDSQRPGFLALVDYAHGDIKHGQRGTALYGPSPGPISAIIGARMGLLDRAQTILASGRGTPRANRPSNPYGQSWAEAIQGEVALQRGQVPEAVEDLEKAVSQPDGTPVYFLAAESLAEALVKTGAVEQAIETLEAAVAERQRSYDPGYGGSWAGYAWLRTRVLEAELLARQGRTTDSQRAAGEVAKLLAKADSDFPLLQRAKQLLHHQ